MGHPCDRGKEVVRRFCWMRKQRREMGGRASTLLRLSKPKIRIVTDRVSGQNCTVVK